MTESESFTDSTSEIPPEIKEKIDNMKLGIIAVSWYTGANWRLGTTKPFPEDGGKPAEKLLSYVSDMLERRIHEEGGAASSTYQGGRAAALEMQGGAYIEYLVPYAEYQLFVWPDDPELQSKYRRNGYVVRGTTTPGVFIGSGEFILNQENPRIDITVERADLPLVWDRGGPTQEWPN